MVTVSFLFLFIAKVFVSYADDSGLDPVVFNKLIEDEKKGVSKEDIFLTHMWPKIIEFFPTEALIPAVEVEYVEESTDSTDKGNQEAKDQEHSGQGENNVADQGEERHGGQGETITTGKEENAQSEKEHKMEEDAREKEKAEKRKNLEEKSYSCQTETKLLMKLDTHEQKTYQVVSGKKKKAQLEVQAHLKIDKPILFDVVVKTYDIENPFLPTKMKYLFNRNNKVKISMLIPDFSANQKVTPECLVTVTDIAAIKFEEPDCSGSEVKDENFTEDENSAKQIPIQYFRYMETTGRFYKAITAGLTKAFIEKVKKAKQKDGMIRIGEKKTWICISDELKKNEPTINQEFTYTEDYNAYCHGAKAS